MNKSFVIFQYKPTIVYLDGRFINTNVDLITFDVEFYSPIDVYLEERIKRIHTKKSFYDYCKYFIINILPF